MNAIQHLLLASALLLFTVSAAAAESKQHAQWQKDMTEAISQNGSHQSFLIERAKAGAKKSSQIEYANCLLQEGHIRGYQKYYPTALRSYQEACAIFSKAGKNESLGTALEGLGETYLRMGNYSAALDPLEKAAKLRKYPIEYQNLIDTYLGLKEVSKAEETAQKWLDSPPRQPEPCPGARRCRPLRAMAKVRRAQKRDLEANFMEMEAAKIERDCANI